MSYLTQLAREQPCTIRIPGHCTGGGPDTVAAHFRSQRLGAGMGIKSADIYIAFSCFICHEIVDSRRMVDGLSKDEIRHAHLMGVLETQLYLLNEGYIRVGKK